MVNAQELVIIPKLRKVLDSLIAKRKPAEGPLDATVMATFTTDEVCSRYLRANDLDYDKGAKQLYETLCFRSVEKPHLIAAQDVMPSLETGKMFECGADRSGHPVIYLRTGLDGASDSSVKIKHLLYILEHTLRGLEIQARTGVATDGKWVLIIDFGYSKSQKAAGKKFSMSDISVGKKMVHILGTHYPERLAKCVFVRPSGGFVAFWNLFVKPFVAKKTVDKMVFLRNLHTNYDASQHDHDHDHDRDHHLNHAGNGSAEAPQQEAVAEEQKQMEKPENMVLNDKQEAEQGIFLQLIAKEQLLRDYGGEKEFRYSVQSVISDIEDRQNRLKSLASS
eukprot:ANDGO_07373.mRNA.1 Phosphatidylinositol transfer protein PDR17